MTVVEHHSAEELQALFRKEQEARWAKRGSRPTAVRQTEYQYVWVIGAASPQTGQAEAILSPVLNTAIINQFLDQFSRALAPDVHAALI